MSEIDYWSNRWDTGKIGWHKEDINRHLKANFVQCQTGTILSYGFRKTSRIKHFPVIQDRTNLFVRRNFLLNSLLNLALTFSSCSSVWKNKGSTLAGRSRLSVMGWCFCLDWKCKNFIPVKVVGVEFCQKACEDFFSENKIEFEKLDSVYKAKTKPIKIYCGDFYTCPITEKVLIK